jgi:hypothetical protein
MALTSAHAIGRYTVARSEEVRMLRLVHLGPNASRDETLQHILALSTFEIFGMVSSANSMICPFTGNGNMNGIIHHLTMACQGNVGDRKLIDIRVSSENHAKGPAKMAVDLMSDEKYCSINLPDQWLCYDFKHATVIPTAYLVKAVTSYRGRPRQWVIEGSNGDGNWIELDNQMDVDREVAIVAFQIAKPIGVRMVRIRQTGPNWENNDVLQFCGFELFGRFVSNPIDGIIANLRKDWPTNFDYTAIGIHASSIQGDKLAKNVLFNDPTKYFCSRDSPDQWISFDFQFRRIDLIKYHLRTPNDCHVGIVREWVLEGSIDGDGWWMIDERKNVETLNHPGATMSFETCPVRKARFIRFRQTRKNWKRDHQLAIAWIDFSGHITYAERIS